MRLARSEVRARDLARALAIAAIGTLGAVPGSRGVADPFACAAWLAIAAAPCGFLAGASGLAAWPIAGLIPAAWMALLVAVDGSSARDLESPAWAALAWSAFFALGFGAGRLFAPHLWLGASLALLVAAAASAAPLAGEIARVPLPPALAARALDLSPAVFVLECGGVDVARHPAVYEAASTVDIDPSLRTPWRASLAAPLAFVVACALAWLAARRWNDPVSRRR